VYVHFLAPIPIRKIYDSSSPSLCAVLGIISYKKSKDEKEKRESQKAPKMGCKRKLVAMKRDRGKRKVTMINYAVE
jgi:hypothetical protein